MKKLFLTSVILATFTLFATACGDDSSSGPEEESSSSIEAEDESSSSVEEEGKSSAKEEGKSSAEEKDAKSSSSEAKKDDSSSSEETTSSSSEAVSSNSNYPFEPVCTVKTENNVVSAEMNVYGTDIGNVRIAEELDYENLSAHYVAEGKWPLWGLNSCDEVVDSYGSVVLCSTQGFEAKDKFDDASAMEEAWGTLEVAQNSLCDWIVWDYVVVDGNLNEKMLKDGKYGKFRDSRDAKLYRTIEIGDQTWMAQNLNYATSSGSACFDDNLAACWGKGRLYTWETAKTVCPDGWKLPTREDFIALIVNADASYDGASTSFNNGEKFRFVAGSGFGFGGSDDFGFTAVGGGTYDGSYKQEHTDAYFWSQTADGESSAYVLWLSETEQGLLPVSTELTMNSVRCIKDDAPSQSVSSN